MDQAYHLDHDAGRLGADAIEHLRPEVTDLIKLGGIGIEDGERNDIAEATAEVFENALDMPHADPHLPADIALADDVSVLIEGDLAGDMDLPTLTRCHALRDRTFRLPQISWVMPYHDVRSLLLVSGQ